MKAPLILLSGPSGVGKTTVVDRLLTDAHPHPIRRAITATTRAKRPGELDNRDYHFWPREQFLAKIAEGQMLEHAIVHGTDYYGTPNREVDPFLAVGTAVILVIDVQGAAIVRKLRPNGHLSVFLMPPSVEALRERLKSRATDDPTSMTRRLETAEKELERRNEFDVRLANDNLEESVRAFAALIEEQFSVQEQR